MKRELCILAAVLLLLTGCNSQKAESPEEQTGTGVTEVVKADPTTQSALDSEAEVPEWWGSYEDGDRQLGITNFNGTMFWFELKAGEPHTLEGAAAVDPENQYAADYMDLHFEYKKETGDVVITLWEEREDSGERIVFTGTYSPHSDQE